MMYVVSWMGIGWVGCVMNLKKEGGFCYWVMGDVILLGGIYWRNCEVLV